MGKKRGILKEQPKLQILKEQPKGLINNFLQNANEYLE